MILSLPHSPGWSMDGSCWVTRSPWATWTGPRGEVGEGPRRSWPVGVGPTCYSRMSSSVPGDLVSPRGRVSYQDRLPRLRGWRGVDVVGM